MADFELSLSGDPSVKDLNFVWAPETGLPKIQGAKSEFGVLAKYKPQDVLQVNNLVDGLYVLPLDEKKQRKLAQKNVKESAGKDWYDIIQTPLTCIELGAYWAFRRRDDIRLWKTSYGVSGSLKFQVLSSEYSS